MFQGHLVWSQLLLLITELNKIHIYAGNALYIAWKTVNNDWHWGHNMSTSDRPVEILLILMTAIVLKFECKAWANTLIFYSYSWIICGVELILKFTCTFIFWLKIMPAVFFRMHYMCEVFNCPQFLYVFRLLESFSTYKDIVWIIILFLHTYPMSVILLRSVVSLSKSSAVLHSCLFKDH